MKALLVVYLTIPFLLNAFGAAPTDDSLALEGLWIPVQAELAGAPLPEAVLKRITLKLAKGVYEVAIEREPQADTGTWTLVPKTDPKAMTITGVKGPNAGKTFLAIYALKGDSLRVCYDLSGTARPTEFKTRAGTQEYLSTYIRKQ